MKGAGQKLGLSFLSASRYNAGMKLRHAGALVTAGWYLLLAPYRGGVLNHPVASKSPSGLYDFSAPLSSWTRQGSFNSQPDCEREKDSLYRQQLDEHQRAKSGTSPLLEKRTAFNQMTRFYRAHCIATDDPRLKGK